MRAYFFIELVFIRVIPNLEGENLTKKAKFKLDFEADSYFDIDREMEVTLPDGSQIVFHKSKAVNRGTIFFEVDEPNEIIARNEGQRRVEQFFNCMLITEDRLESLKAINFPRKPELLNPKDFEGVPKTGYADLQMGSIFVAPLKQQTLPATTDLLAKIGKLTDEKQNIISRSLSWFRKASEVDGEDRFIFRWISFEALLGLLGKRRATQNLIPEFVDRFLETKTARKIFHKHQRTVEDLANANLVSWGGVPYSEQLIALLKRGNDPRAILPKATLCIFEVRNNLFHKGEALELLKGSSSLLRNIIRECLKLYVQREAH